MATLPPTTQFCSRKNGINFTLSIHIVYWIYCFVIWRQAGSAQSGVRSRSYMGSVQFDDINKVASSATQSLNDSMRFVSHLCSSPIQIHKRLQLSVQWLTVKEGEQLVKKGSNCRFYYIYRYWSILHVWYLSLLIHKKNTFEGRFWSESPSMLFPNSAEVPINETHA